MSSGPQENRYVGCSGRSSIPNGEEEQDQEQRLWRVQPVPQEAEMEGRKVAQADQGHGIAEMEPEPQPPREIFEHLMNKDNSTTVLWLTDVQRIIKKAKELQLERDAMKSHDDGNQSRQSSSSESEDPRQPVETKSFTMLKDIINCEIGIYIGPSDNAKRMKRGMCDVMLTLELISKDEKFVDRTVRVDIRTFCKASDKPSFKPDSISIGGGPKTVLISNCECYQDDDRIAFDIHYDTKAFCEEDSQDHPGLVNMGMTCYMNSYLQTMFHLKDFVRYIFSVSGG